MFFNNYEAESDMDRQTRRRCNMQDYKLMAFRKHMVQFYYNKIAENPEIVADEFPHEYQKDFIEFCHYANAKRKGEGTYFWITINPQPKTDLPQFLRLLEKSVKKKWIAEYLYNIEQRGEDPDNIGQGLHSHMLICSASNKRHSEVKREFYNTFKHVVGNKQHVHVLTSYRPSIHFDYLHGKKQQKKVYLVINDKEYRKQNGLKEVYGSLTLVRAVVSTPSPPHNPL